MNEYILLTFLSDVKVFGGKVSEVEYDNIKGSEKTHTTNESAVRYILKNEGEISRIFILASKMIRGEIRNFQPATTHLDYFKNRMKIFLPNVEYTAYNFDEDLTGEENLKSVAAIAKMIQDYAKNREIILHVDLTGGMRHINMLMLDIIRLLDYSGIKIGLLIYSNYKGKDKKSTVEEVKNIYDLFQLISGVEEFINFGSVKALKKYYADIEQSKQLKKLTDAMENFAESIKLCRYGQFIDAIKRLHDAINDFKTVSEDFQDILMARLIGKIREKYQNLIDTRGEDDLKIIRWCVEHGYLQQALTLYTERVPEYLCKNFITPNKEITDDLNKKLEGDNRNYGFYLLNNYLDDNADLKIVRADLVKNVESLNEKYFQTLKEIINAKNFSYDYLKENFFKGLVLQRGINFANENKLQLQFEALEKIYKNIVINKNGAFLLNLDSPELLPLKKILDSIKPPLQNISKGFQRWNEIFKFLNSASLQEYFPAFEFDKRICRIDYMLKKKIFAVAMDEEKFFSIMTKYFILKDERNHSNHARPDETGEFETAKDLEDFMKGGLDEIEQCRKSFCESYQSRVRKLERGAKNSG